MQQISDQLLPDTPRPRTTSVLALLAAAALIFSYLFSYALTNALVAANLMQSWQPGHDPRPRRMLIGFVSVLILIMTIAAIARWVSKRQLARIDEMEEEERGEE
jgi:hypothetical protein